MVVVVGEKTELWVVVGGVGVRGRGWGGRGERVLAVWWRLEVGGKRVIFERWGSA